jgi:hypothetical protein
MTYDDLGLDFMIFADLASEPDPAFWLPWELRVMNDGHHVLVLRHEGHALYEVCLDATPGAVEALGWIAQVARKPWDYLPGVTMADIVYGLVRGMDDMLGLQSRLVRGRPSLLTQPEAA